MSAKAVGRRSAAALLIPAVLAGGCSSAPPRSETAETKPALSAWGPCAEPPPAPGARLECATIAVPYDYNIPDGPTFTIPLIRIPSAAEKPQLLMMNPGGPGISGVGDVRAEWEYYATLADVYTVVSFDPRGVGGSVPAVSCLDEQQKSAIFDQPSVPLNDADRQRRQDLAAGIGEACERQFSTVLGALGTENVARDVNAIRAAMGFEKTSFLGYSYGTFIGALYAQNFPEHTGRVALDSVLAPQLDYREVRHAQARGMQASVTGFAADCLRQNGCPLTGPVDNAVQTVIDLIAQLDRQPYIGADGRQLSGSRMLAFVESMQYQPMTGWPSLRDVLAKALAGDWPPVLDAAYSPDLMVNPADSEYLAVVCTDFAAERDPQAPERLAPLWAQESPVSGANRAWSLAPCESWPVPAVRKPGPVNPDGAGPVLILSTAGDPATPLEWARSLHEQIGGSTLVVAPGPGHLASSQNTCADEALIAFLKDGTLPAGPEFTCPPNA